MNRSHLLSLIFLLAASVLFNACGDADASYEGDPIEVLEEEAEEQEKPKEEPPPESSPIIDSTPPVLKEVTAVASRTNDTSPSYTFSSSEEGLISYGGLCDSNLSIATIGNNFLIFKTKGDGSYADCVIYVTDSEGNTGKLEASAFTVDTVSPVLSEVTPVPSRTNNSTPSYTFHSSKAGTISYSGSCTSSGVSGVKGDNTVTFSLLLSGNYDDCKIILTDLAGNSETLNVRPFSVDTVHPSVTSSYPANSETSVPWIHLFRLRFRSR